jgi:hypothetical protein
MYAKWKIVHTSFNNGWSTVNKTELTEFSDILISYALGEKKDTFKFTLRNIYGKYNGFFKAQDRIEIYLALNTEIFPANPFFVGLVSDTPNQTDYQKNRITINGFSFSEFVLNAQTFTDPGGASMTISEGLRDAIAQAGSINPMFKVVWDNGNNMLNSLGNPFPLLPERFLYKPLREIFEKYSTNEYTRDGFYYWYVTPERTLVWKRGDTFSSDSYNYVTMPTLNFKYSLDTSKVVNFVVCKFGRDPLGRAISGKPVIDEASKAKHGTKFFYYTRRATYAEEINSMDLNKAYGNAQNINTKFPDFSTQFETSWAFHGGGESVVVIEGVTCTDGQPVTIPSGTQSDREKTYVAILRQHVANFIRAEGMALIQLRQFGQNKVELAFKLGEKTWGIGTIVSLNLPMLSSSIINMRVREVQYSEETVTYYLEEEIAIQ